VKFTQQDHDRVWDDLPIDQYEDQLGDAKTAGPPLLRARGVTPTTCARPPCSRGPYASAL